MATPDGDIVLAGKNYKLISFNSNHLQGIRGLLRMPLRVSLIPSIETYLKPL